MKCPFCSHGVTKVIDKRLSDRETNRRRRECLKCGKRFTTYERPDISITVIKKDGRREPFSRDKIKTGIEKSCQKRPISQEKIEKVVDEIESELRQKAESGEVKSKVIGELVMDKLRDLDEVAYIRYASIYRAFRDLSSFEKELKRLKVVGEMNTDSTDMSLFVSTPTGEHYSEWDRSRITKALIKEAGMDKKTAEDISKSVERKVLSSGIKKITVRLIRELVDNELFERGLEKKLVKQEMVGMPTYDLNQIIFSKSNENSNIIANNPEAVNLNIAENTLKQYALKQIFSADVAEAHLTGAMHLHDLGYPIRCYCSSHSIEYIKKYGLRLNNVNSASSPAKHAMTLTGHINTFLATMQAYYAGALGLGFLNILYSPYLVGMSDRRLKQEAQYLIFSASQNAFSRGGQTLFEDFNINLGVPSYLANVPAIGPGGKYMLRKPNGGIEFLDEVPRDKSGNVIQPKNGRILTYKDFEKEAQRFAKALLDVWREGDVDGKPFPFPKCDLHINSDVFNDPVQYKLFQYACLISSENGAPYFVFDRDDVNLSMCCRLRTKVTDNSMIKYPESMRFCGFHIVTVNLPQAAYRAGKGNVDKCIKEIYKTMDLAMKAHLQKKKFIERLMSEPGNPLWQVGMVAADGKRYIDLDKATYLIGLIGLNECVKYLTGKELHEDIDAYKLGLKIVSAMYLKAKEFEKEYKLKVTLEETPADSASLRLAKLDLANYPESRDYIKGDIKKGEVYYTNSIHFAPDAPVDIVKRITGQAKFNTMIESGAITHVFVGEQRPDPKSIENLVRKTWENTESAQIVISPEFTICYDCQKTSPGFKRGGEARCGHCGSENVYGMSRVVGYYSIIGGKYKTKVNGKNVVKTFEVWNKGKQAEFRDRQKGNYSVPPAKLVATQVKR